MRSLVAFIFFHFLCFLFYLSFPHSLSISFLLSSLPLSQLLSAFSIRFVFTLAHVDNMEIENVDLLNKPLSACLQVDKMLLIFSVLTDAIYHD